MKSVIEQGNSTLAKMCTPWEAVRFEKIMFKDIPDDQCDFCLPDCSETQYTTSTTVVPFRRCDYKNLGVSYLCDLNDLNLPEPRIWGSQVIEEYSNRGNGELPWFIKEQVCTLWRYRLSSFQGGDTKLKTFLLKHQHTQGK